MKETIAVSGIMLRNSGDQLIVEVEVDGEWVMVIREPRCYLERSVGHIVEPSGIAKAAMAKKEGAHES